jgi:hypothetical protein
MKSRKFIAAILFFLFSLNLAAQENLFYEKNLQAYCNYFSREFGIDCNIPGRFTNMDKYYVIWKVRKNMDKHTGSMYGPLFLSKDKNCFLMYPSIPRNVSKGNIYMKEGAELSFNPRNQVKAEINTALGLYYHHGNKLNDNTTTFDFNGYVTVLSGKKAKEMFNADSLYIYDIPAADSVFFIDESLEKLRKRKYPYCAGLVLIKNERVVLDFKFFFTEKGNRKKEEYFNMLSKKVWYNEKFKKE